MTTDQLVFSEGSFGWAVGLILMFFALSNYALYRVVKPIEDKRDAWMSAHVFILLLPPLILYLISDVPDSVFKVAVFSAFVFPLLFQEIYVRKVVAFFHKELALEESIDLPDERA